MVTKEKIWDYIDGNLTESEHREIAEGIDNDATVAVLYLEASAMHTHLQSLTPEQPSMAFTENLMRALVRLEYISAPRVPILPLVIGAVPFLLVLGLTVAYFVSSGGDLYHIYHINSHITSIMKLLFLLIDSTLLMFFAEQWLLAKKNRLA